MVKKYHQTREDRKHESTGMKKYERSRHERSGMDSGYMGMISEDHSAPANLPQEVKHTYYPKCDYLSTHYLDDSIKGIDETSRDNINTTDRHQSDSKY